MNMRTVLSGITAILAVGVFYTFSFCFVEEVDENSISMDYYYATETEEQPPEIVTLFEEEDSVFAYLNIEENLNQNNQSPLKDDVDDVDTAEADVDAIKANIVTDVPASVLNAEQNNTVLADSNYKKELDSDSDNDNSSGSEDTNSGSYNSSDTYEDDDEMLYEEEYDAAKFGEDDDSAEGSFVAENQSVFAEDSPQDTKLLSRFDDGSEFSDMSDVPSVPMAEYVVTFDDSIVFWDSTIVTTPTETGKSDISTDETFTARYNGGVHTVNAYDLICQIVNNEISSSFSDEAIKAQAVAAYSYVKYHNVNGLTPTVLVKSSPAQKIKDLVSEVFGITCYYNGKVAQTVYMASSSGYTASAENVWGGSNFPYLSSVQCSFDSTMDPNYGKTVSFSESDIRKALENSLGINLSDNPSNWLNITSYVDGNYVSSIDVDGQANVSGKKLRETILSYKIRSAAFDVYYSDGYFTFTTYGYGHGVGMSQNGANYLGKQGYSYTDILKFYFTGIEVY